jgi:hypothetical protein
MTIETDLSGDEGEKVLRPGKREEGEKSSNILCNLLRHFKQIAVIWCF